MILDERTEFCDATALNTGGAGSYLLGDVIDLQAIGIDLGSAIAQSQLDILACAAGNGEHRKVGARGPRDDDAAAGRGRAAAGGAAAGGAAGV